jgi:acetoacetate decarboxylase
MIKVADWGFTNPIISDLYGKPPLVWKDMDIHLVVYETDTENIEKVIPEPLKARTNTVIVWQSHFDLGTTQGAFSETAIYVQVEYNGIKGDYEPFLYVDNHLPLTGGREIWGYQKKMAEMEMAHEMEAVRWQTNRLGHEIVKALVVPRYEAKMDEIPWSPDGVFSLKYIPSAEEGGEPIRELILTEGQFTAKEGKFFGGPASIRFERSEIDPTYILEPKKILGGYFGKGDLYLPMGKIVYNYK